MYQLPQVPGAQGLGVTVLMTGFLDCVGLCVSRNSCCWNSTCRDMVAVVRIQSASREGTVCKAKEMLFSMHNFTVSWVS